MLSFASLAYLIGFKRKYEEVRASSNTLPSIPVGMGRPNKYSMVGARSMILASCKAALFLGLLCARASAIIDEHTDKKY